MFQNLINQFEKTRSVSDLPGRDLQRTVSTSAAGEAERQSVFKDATSSGHYSTGPIETARKYL